MLFNIVTTQLVLFFLQVYEESCACKHQSLLGNPKWHVPNVTWLSSRGRRTTLICWSLEASVLITGTERELTFCLDSWSFWGCLNAPERLDNRRKPSTRTTSTHCMVILCCAIVVKGTSLDRAVSLWGSTVVCLLKIFDGLFLAVKCLVELNRIGYAT